jgi:hypothetical protein
VWSVTNPTKHGSGGRNSNTPASSHAATASAYQNKEGRLHEPQPQTATQGEAMNIIYEDDATDVHAEWIVLNGHEGAVNLSDSGDDLDITFEDMETAREWVATIAAGLDMLDPQ